MWQLTYDNVIWSGKCNSVYFSFSKRFKSAGRKYPEFSKTIAYLGNLFVTGFPTYPTIFAPNLDYFISFRNIIFSII